MARGEKELE